MQPVSHRAGRQLHLNVWVFGPHLWHCSVPVLGLKKPHRWSAKAWLSPLNPLEIPCQNIFPHLLAACLMWLLTKEMARDTGWGGRIEWSAARDSDTSWITLKPQSEYVLRHTQSCFSSVLMCSGEVETAFSHFLQPKAAVAGFKHPVTPPSFPQHLGQPYFITFFFLQLHVYQEPYSSCPGEMASCLWVARAVISLRLQFDVTEKYPAQHKQCMSAADPPDGLRFPQWARQQLCLIPALITLSNHCTAAKVKDSFQLKDFPGTLGKRVITVRVYCETAEVLQGLCWWNSW